MADGGSGSPIWAKSLERLAARLRLLEAAYEEADSKRLDAPDIGSLVRLVHAEICWQPEGRWDRTRDGCGLLEVTEGGFRIKAAARHSQQWRRFVVAHEVGHTLFFDSALSPKKAPLRPLRDIWVRSADEERLCDSIADRLLVPLAEIERALRERDERLAQIEQIARRCCVPIDCAFRRWLNVAPPSHAARRDSADAIAIWRVLEGEEHTSLLYCAGRLRSSGGRWALRDVGLHGETRSAREMGRGSSLLISARCVAFAGLREMYGLEVTYLGADRDGADRYLTAYDRIDGLPGCFDPDPAWAALSGGQEAKGGILQDTRGENTVLALPFYRDPRVA